MGQHEQLENYRSKKENDWEQMYMLFVEYYESTGNADLLATVIYKDQNIGRWLNNQRTLYRTGKLSDEKIELLEKVGVRWNTRDSKWIAMFNMYKEYIDKNGTTNVALDENNSNKAIGIWINEQRKLYKRGALSEERIKALESIGVMWDNDENTWFIVYDQLRKYYEVHGNIDIVSSYSNNGHYLAEFLNKQRKFKMSGELSEKKEKLLDLLGMDWDILPQRWRDMYFLTKEYKSEFGVLPTSKNVIYKGQPIGNWYLTQINILNNSAVSTVKTEKMEALIG